MLESCLNPCLSENQRIYFFENLFFFKSKNNFSNYKQKLNWNTRIDTFDVTQENVTIWSL